MSELDSVIGEAVSRQDAPFLVAMTGNAAGVTWSGAAGERSPGKPATVDTVFRIFSMTKAVGSTAAMILMDRGKLSPDATVESIVPEFGALKVLEGFGPDGPKMRTQRVKPTVRHLANPYLGAGVRILESGRAPLHGSDRAPEHPVGTAGVDELPVTVRRGRALGLRHWH